MQGHTETMTNKTTTFKINDLYYLFLWMHFFFTILLYVYIDNKGLFYFYEMQAGESGNKPNSSQITATYRNPSVFVKDDL